MMKCLTVKLLIVTFFQLTLLPMPLLAQEEDFDLDEEVWSDDEFEESSIEDEPAAPAPAKKSEKKDKKSPKSEKTQNKGNVSESKKVTPSSAAPKNDAEDEELPDFDNAIEKAPEKKAPPRQIQPAKTVSPSLTPTPIVSKPKAVFEPVKQTLPEYNVNSVVKRAGPPLVLITRPVYASYSNEQNTMYISAVTEAYFHFKIGSLPGIQVIPMERINNNVQYFRDFSRRISRVAYIESAKKLGATYVLYQEYEPKGKKVKFALELFSISENRKITGVTNEISISDLEDGLYDFVNEISGSLIGTIPQKTQKFLAAPVLGNKIEPLGNLIVSVGDFTQKRVEKVAPQFEKFAKDKNLHLAKFVAAQMLARAKKYPEAIAIQRQLNAVFGDQYPGLSLQLASLNRMAESFDDALEAADDAGRDPSLKLPVKIEKARTYEAKGELNQAKREYESVLSEGGEDGEIYFQLALVSIGLKDLSQTEKYLEKAAAAGRALDRGDYYELGLRYEALGNASEQAITAFRNSLGMQQDNEDAWHKLAEIYSISGRQAEAAECYVSLFHLNNDTYKEYLKKAGIMFEGAGYLENAKEAYALFLARRYHDAEVSVRLAKIEMQSGNCPKAIELVDGMDTTGTFGQDVSAINTQCGKQERRVVIPTETERDKGWRGRFWWRVSSAAILAAGVGTGIVLDRLYINKCEEYEAYNANDNTKSVETRIAEVKKLREQSLDLKKLRNMSYLGGVGIGGVSFGLSIVLPIVLH